MKRRAWLPLGVDVGMSRVRIAALEQTADGPRLYAAAARDLPQDSVGPIAIENVELVAATIDDLRRELGCPQRRCVLSMSPAAANVRLMEFPSMSWSERRRCARFEAQRYDDAREDIDLCGVRVRTVDRVTGIYAIGLARVHALSSRMRCAKAAGLRVTAVDYDPFVWRRLYPYVDAVLDVGCERSFLHAFAETGPHSAVISAGGIDVTRAIASDLSIDEDLAEKRKRILGTAGAGERARERFAALVAAAMEGLADRARVRRIALCGNGARLPGLCSAIEARTAAVADMPVCDALRDGAYPDDVVRAAAPDWTFAAGLALWRTA